MSLLGEIDLWYLQTWNHKISARLLEFCYRIGRRGASTNVETVLSREVELESAIMGAQQPSVIAST